MIKYHLKTLFKDFYIQKNYIMIATALFVIAIIVGMVSDTFREFLNAQIEGLAEIARDLFEGDNPQVKLFWFIFLNNATKAVGVIYLGLIFGAIPVIFLLINGMVLGYLYSQLVVTHSELTTWDFMVSILPHGIIELPIVIIACAYGLRMGAYVWSWLLRIGTERAGENRGEMKRFFRGSLRISLFIVVALFIAAAIEATITPWLMGL